MKKEETMKEQLRLMTEDRDAQLFQSNDLRSRVTKAESQIAEQEAKISTLKSELAAAIATVSRQQGYIDRVLEDDSVKEGKTRGVSDVQTRTELLRQGPPQFVTGGSSLDRVNFREDSWNSGSARAPLTRSNWFDL